MPDTTSYGLGAVKHAVKACSSPELEIEAGDVDVSLLEGSLRMSPWERMLANDDALNLAESLRAAMERRSAKS